MVIFAVAVRELAAFVYPLISPDLSVFVMRSNWVSAIQADANKSSFADFVSVTANFWMINSSLDFNWNPKRNWG